MTLYPQTQEKLNPIQIERGPYDVPWYVPFLKDGQDHFFGYIDYEDEQLLVEVIQHHLHVCPDYEHDCDLLRCGQTWMEVRTVDGSSPFFRKGNGRHFPSWLDFTTCFDFDVNFTLHAEVINGDFRVVEL